MNSRLMIAGACAMAMFAGCVSYNGRSVAADEAVDEANQAYVVAAQKAFAARMKDPARPVVVAEAPEMSNFLDIQKSMFGGHPLCDNLDVRKEVALAFKEQLRSRVSRMDGFKLVDEGQAKGGEMASTYRLTYSVTGLELKENVTDNFNNGRTGAAVDEQIDDAEIQKLWDGIAKVEVKLFKPGETAPIFSFAGKGVFNKISAEILPLDKTFLLEAAKIAANNAIDGYVQKFGPPVFVTETCQGGQFARLSVGSKFGVQAGQRVEFYRNTSREVVGNGVVGKGNAPVEGDGAWVLVEDFDENNRTVFRWTSARILPARQ